MYNLKHRRHIETIKNIILVVLFFSTMLLLYIFWVNPISNGLKISNFIGSETLDMPNFQSVTEPEKIIVHLGDDSYTVLETYDYDAWNTCIKSLSKLSKDQILSINEITADQFDQIMEFKSITYEFLYDLPYDVFAKKYEASEIHSLEQIGDFSTIAFSSGSPESIFFYSGMKDKYYRIVSDDPHVTLDKLLTEIEDESDFNYHRIGTLVGTTNKTIIPMFKDSSRSELAYTSEFVDLSSAEVKKFAQSFFGESLDFVREIRGSKGTLTYMYGYGEKVLTISADGKVEFKNKEKPQGPSQNYFDALDTALFFVASHGGWKLGEGIEIHPYVMSVKAVEYDKQKGYNIIFGMKLPTGSLYLEEGHSIMIEIINGQVTQYTRNMIIIGDEEFKHQMSGGTKETYSVINMIAQNYSYMAEILTGRGYDFDQLKGEELFDAILNTIISVKSGYLKPLNDNAIERNLMPVWVVNVNDILMYFDLYDAKPLGFTVLFEF